MSRSARSQVEAPARFTAPCSVTTQKAWVRDDKAYTDMISGKEGDAGTVRLEAGGFRWLLHKF